MLNRWWLNQFMALLHKGSRIWNQNILTGSFTKTLFIIFLSSVLTYDSYLTFFLNTIVILFLKKADLFSPEPKLDLWGLTQTTNEVLWSPWAGNVNRLSEILPPRHHRHDLSTVCQSRLPPRLLPLSLTSLQRWRWRRRRRWWWGVRQKTPPQERMQEGRTGSLLEVAWEGFSHMLRLSGGLTSRYRSSVTSLKVQHHCE